MNIFSESNYQVILRTVVEERKNIDSKFHFQAMSEATRIPKSYISKVVTEKAHFSSDQLYSICDFLGFNRIQTRYMLLLLEVERSSVKRRKEELLIDIGTIREQALDTSEHIKANSNQIPDDILRDYFLDPINQVVHMCLSIPRYQSEPQKLAAHLGVPVSEILKVIETLEQLGVIEHRAGKIKVVINSMHLPKTSSAYKPWRNQLKLLSMERLNRSMRKRDYSFSVTFSANSKTRDKIQAEFLELLKKAENLTENAKIEDAYQLSFDLFSWTEADNE